MRQNYIWLISLAVLLGFCFGKKSQFSMKLDWELTRLKWSDYRHGNPPFVCDIAKEGTGVAYTFTRGATHKTKGWIPVVTYDGWMKVLEAEMPRALKESNPGKCSAALVVSTPERTVALRIGEHPGESSALIQELMDESFPGIEIFYYMKEVQSHEVDRNRKPAR